MARRPVRGWVAYHNTCRDTLHEILHHLAPMRVFEHVALGETMIRRGARCARAGVVAAALTCTLLDAPSTFGQAAGGTALTGVWRAGSTQIDVSVESWGEDCGPRPQSSRSGGGGIVNIEQSGGQLVIHGRGQDIRSDACWSRNPSMKRQAASFTNSAWITRCKTAANDPREEQGTYTLKIANPDTVTYQDVSRYNWALNQSKCVATFTTIQTLTRRDSKSDSQALDSEKQKPTQVATGPSKIEVVKPTVTPPPPDPEDNEKTACSPGAPHKLTLRPKTAEIEVGERVCFKPRIVDKANCLITDQTVRWSLSHSKALRGTLTNGCFNAAETAAEAEGDFKIAAALGPLRGEAKVSVHPVDLSSLIAMRMGGGALTGFEDAAPLPAAPKSVTRVATRNEPVPSTASPRKLIGIALGIAATALALAALWLSRRKPARAEAISSPPSISSFPPPPPKPRAPVAHTRAEVVPAAPLPIPAPVPAPVVAAVAVAPEPQRPMSSGPPPSEPWICPKCRVGYPAHQQTCPKDGTALMPYVEFARNRKRTEEEKKKRCPKCGSVFPSHASFCAEDGTPLVDA
jgi:hypothetical protein